VGGIHFELDAFVFFVGGHGDFIDEFYDGFEMHFWTFRSLISTGFLLRS
jgi:hypothetical protein